MNRQRDVFSAGSVVVNGTKIEKVSPGDARLDGPFENVIDASGMIVIPGLINAHQHFYYHLFKGLANGLLIEDWFPQVVFKVTPYLTDDDMELTSYLANIEMLLSGTTCSLNHLRLASTEATLEKLSRPAIELGIRQVVGKEVQCRLPGNPRHPRTLPEEIAFLDGLIPHWQSRSDGLIRLCLAVECNAVAMEAGVASESMLIECKELSDRFGLKVSTHHAAGTLSFDKSYLQLMRKTGRTETQALAQLGLLDDHFILAHCIHCSETDIELIAGSGASVVYTPTSEAIRAGGIGPAAAMARAGVNVALGSDGPMVDYSVDMVEQMKACLLLQNVKHLDPSAMPPERSLEFATINAAKALGLEHEIGSLEPGKRADIAMFNLANPHCGPVNNPVSALVCSAKGSDAHTVLVNGKVVVREYQLVSRVDVHGLLDRGQRRAAEIIARAELNQRTMPQWSRG
ncbi:MAG: amidohydrolase family protein [Xanthobacteraceae bacterium]|nr:amidohydrolase family protein [Xanthobacteraceae bacterium]